MRRGPNYYVVTVTEGQRGALDRALAAPANREVFVEFGGGRYADGSTSWEVAVASPSTRQRIQDVLWQSGISWCAVREMTEREIEESM